MLKTSFYAKLNPKERYILICCFFVFAVNGLYAMSLGSLLPFISQEYGLSNTFSGGLISAHQTGNLVAGFIAGVLPIYLGRKKAIIFLCSFVAVGFFIMMVTGNPVLLLLGFIFTGISRGSISNFNNTVVNEVSNSSPSALSFLHSVFAVGALLAPLLVIFSTHYFEGFGWRMATTIIIMLVLISMVLFSRMQIDETAKRKQKGLSYAFLGDKYFWVSAGILFFYLCAEATITGWLVKYFIDAQIMTASYAQLLNSLLWVVILAGRLTTVVIGHRFPKEKILTIASLFVVVFYVLMIVTQHVGIITIAIMGLGFSMAGIYPTTVATVGPTLKAYPMAMGVLLLLGGVGAIVMPTVTGAISDQFGILAGMSAIVVVVALMFGCVLIHVMHQRRRHG